MSDNSKNCTITNNTTIAALILDAYNVSSTNPQQVYGQTLKVLPLVAGGNVLTGAATGTVVLDDYSTVSGKQIYNTLYELIIARSTDLFPLDNTSLMQSFAVPPAYPPVTVSVDALTNMQSALQFYQTIMAFPTSTLSQQFQSAMTSATSSTSTASIDTTMNAFFSGTKQYQKVTFSMYMAVTTYMANFANIWANFGSSYTYYIYSSGTSSQSSSSANPTYKGSVVFTQNAAPTVADPTDHNGDYEITFVDPNNNQTKLYYSQGQLVSSLTIDIPPICLQGTFVLKSQLSNNADDNQLIPVISGMVNGVQVMGTDSKQDTPDAPGSLYAFFHPNTFQGWVNLFMTVFGALMALEWVGTKLWSLGKGLASLFKKDNGAPPEPSEMEELQNQINDLQDQIQTNQQELLDRFNAQQELPPSVDEALANLKTAMTDQLNVQSSDVQMDILNEQAGQIQELAEYGVTPEMEGIADDIRTNMEALQNATNPAELQTALDNVKASIPDINTRLNNVVEQMGEQISEDTKAAIDDSNAAIEEYQDISDDIDNDIDDIDDGDIPDIDPVE